MTEFITNCSLPIAIVFLVIGFVLLVKGADFFVEGSSSIAKKFKVPSKHIHIRQSWMQDGHGAVTVGSEIAAGVEDREPGPGLTVHVAPRREQLMQRKPAGYALVARLLEAEAAVCEQLDRAPAGLLPPVPQVGRRKPNIDLFSGRLAGENARGGFRDNQTWFI